MASTRKKPVSKKTVSKRPAAAKKAGAVKKKPVTKKPAARKPAPAEAAPKKKAGRQLLHPFHHRTELIAVGLSPDGRHLATGSFVGEDYDAGGDLLLWEVATGRVVNHFRIAGGVGWPDYAGCIQWSPDGKRLALAANTNGIVFLDPFALGGKVGKELYLTDGWSRPPSFTWAPDSKRVFVSCWRSSYHPKTRKPLPPVEGTDVPGCLATVDGEVSFMQPGVSEGAWRGNSAGDGQERRIEPPRTLRWAKDRLLAVNGHGQLFALDLRTRRLSWLESSSGPVAFSPDGAFIARVDGGLQLRTADGARAAWASFAVPEVQALAWSPDGKRLAVLEGPDDEPQRVALFEVNAADERVRLLGRIEAAPHARGSWPGDFDPFAWGPKSDAVAFIDAEERVQVWSVAPAPALRSTFEVSEARGLLWAPGERLIAWSGRSLTFIDVGDRPKFVVRALFDTPTDDGPLGTERLKPYASAQFPLGKPGARVWGALLGGVLVVPEGHDAEAAELLGWSDGRTSAPLDSAPVKRFTSIAAAIRAEPKAFPLEVRDAHGGGARAAPSWGVSVEPRELFDLWALIELEAAEATDAWRASWYALLLGRLYHRAGMDDAALKALEKATRLHDAVRVRLELALSCAVRGELDRARRYSASVGEDLFTRAYQQTPSLASQGLALRAALRQLLEGKDASADLDAAEKGLEPENNPGEKRLRVALARLALGEFDRALAHAPRLRPSQKVTLLREATPRGLADFKRLARACTSNDFDVLYMTVDGFLALGAIDDAFESLSWFEGLSTTGERTRILEAGLRHNFETAPEYVTRQYERARSAVERLDCVRLMAQLDAARAREWLAKERGASNARCLAAAALGDAVPAAEALDEARFDAAVDALEADGRLWPTLGAKALERVLEEKNSLLLAGLANAASRGADPQASARAKVAAIEHVDLERHWEVGAVAARFARAGDDEGAFAVLQRMPKTKRSYAIPQVAMELGARLAEKPEPRAWAAAYGLLSALPTDNLGTGGRAFETSRVLRRVFKWSRAEWDGLLD
jgi:Tol biopolymer transport system component